MTEPLHVTYLRSGRVVRGTGTVVDRRPGAVKVKPDRPDWRHVWITDAEIDAGREKPGIQKREPRATDAPKKERKPKAVPVPAWKAAIEDANAFLKTYEFDTWLNEPKRLIRRLVSELEQSRTLFQSCPPRK